MTIFAGIAILSPFIISQINVWMVAAQVNTWLAIFNLIPFGILDGWKVFRWNKIVWVITFTISIILIAYTYGALY